MQNENTTKSVRVTDGYKIRKQLHKGFKVVEYYHFEYKGKAVTNVSKRSVKKNLLLTEAEELLYKLERKQQLLI